MSKSTDQLIAELSQDLKPTGAFFRPGTRALILGLGFLVFNVIAMLAYQAFRPHFLDQVLEHSRFAIEIISATVFTSLLLYFAFSFMVPGEKIKNAFVALGTLSFLTLLASLYLAFGARSPAPSPVGARAFCVEEVLVYGLLGVGMLFFFAQKSYFALSRWQYFLMGMASGLVPGALMQLACMYSPMHSVLLHYGPALVLGGLAALILPFLKRT